MELKQEACRPLWRAGKLLIVPYGIETIVADEILNEFGPFNRTLWN